MSQVTGPAAVRERVEQQLRTLHETVTVDTRGDLVLQRPGASVRIRLIGLEPNVTAVRPEPELGRFLLEANAALPCGGLRLDAERPAVVYADALLGDYLNAAELLVAVAAAAAATQEHAPRVKARFGGSLFSEI